MNRDPKTYRILCIGETWLGSNARAAFMALRRLGHSIQIIDEHQYTGATWRSNPARIARRLLRPLLAREMRNEAMRLTELFQPHALFVFKGNIVHPDVICFYKKRGIPTMIFYPDGGLWEHGPYVPRALPLYDHVFTTKSWGAADMQSQLGVKSVSFLEHGFDPEIHRPLSLTQEEISQYGCDVIFIGTWSRKKELLLAHLKKNLPEIKLRIWGSQWEKSTSSELASSIIGKEIISDAYSRVLQASSICLGLLIETRPKASSGDLITSRTFNIPACGAFMLHERNAEAVRYFQEDEETAFFGSFDELVEKVRFYLDHPDRRAEVARKGRERCITSGYAIDDRMKEVIRWFNNHIISTKC